MALPVFDLVGFARWGFDKIADAAKWVLFRGLLFGAIATLVPIAIFAGWAEICKFIMNAANANMGDGTGLWSGSVVEYTGMAAWLATQLKLPECMSVLLSAMGIKFALSFLRR